MSFAVDYDERTRSGAIFDPDRIYRYVLTRQWDEREVAIAVFVMLNPSTADALHDDPTIRRCIGFAKSWRMGGLAVVNLFALRSTDPAALIGHPDPVGPENQHAIDVTLSDPAVACVVAAWGAHVTKVATSHVPEVASATTQPVWCFGRTKAGHPRHPLYLKNGTQLEVFA